MKKKKKKSHNRTLQRRGETQDSRVRSIYRPQIRAEGSQRQDLVEDTEYLRKNYSLCFWKRDRDCKAVRQGALQQPEPQVGQGLQWPIKGGGGVGWEGEAERCSTLVQADVQAGSWQQGCTQPTLTGHGLIISTALCKPESQELL